MCRFGSKPHFFSPGNNPLPIAWDLGGSVGQNASPSPGLGHRSGCLEARVLEWRHTVESGANIWIHPSWWWRLEKLPPGSCNLDPGNILSPGLVEVWLFTPEIP